MKYIILPFLALLLISNSNHRWQFQKLAQVEKTQLNPATEITNLEDVLTEDVDYHYSSASKLSPFLPPVMATNEIKEKALVTPLTHFSIDQLQVVGIWVVSQDNIKALIMTPENEGIIIKPGDPIGNRSGKVIDIKSEVVVVREFSMAPDGTREFEDYKLPISSRPAKPVTVTVEQPATAAQ